MKWTPIGRRNVRGSNDAQHRNGGQARLRRLVGVRVIGTKSVGDFPRSRKHTIVIFSAKIKGFLPMRILAESQRTAVLLGQPQDRVLETVPPRLVARASAFRISCGGLGAMARSRMIAKAASAMRDLFKAAPKLPCDFGVIAQPMGI
jgi:hypothetical protein